MKLSRADIDELRERIQSAVKNQQLTVTDLGRVAGVHPSQVGRICRGEFRTMSHNVVQVCRALGLNPEARPATERDAAWAPLARDLERLWESDPERARQMARLLDEVAKLALR